MISVRPKYPPVALEIGDGYATAVRVQRRGGRSRVLYWHRVALPRRESEAEGLGEALMLDDELRLPLEDLIMELGKTKAISLALPDTAVRTFFLEIENHIKSDRELRKMILFKITKLAPISVEGTALSYQRLRPREGGGDHYLALLASRKVTASYEQFFAKRGIHLGLVESSSLAAANLFEPVLRRELGDYALLRVELGHFSAALFRDGLLTFSRTRIGSAGESIADSITAEMRTLSLFAQDKLGSSGIERVFVYGPGDSVGQAADLLESRGFPARVLALDEVADVPSDLLNRIYEQGSLVAAAGSALRR